MVNWVTQMAYGIDALHQMGIIHRDIKPENILLDQSNKNIKIFDFGSAYTHSKPVSRKETYSDDPIGTRPYLAPERVEGKPYGPMVDYWALGCVLFTIISFDVSFRFYSSFFVVFPWRGIHADVVR